MAGAAGPVTLEVGGRVTVGEDLTGLPELCVMFSWKTPGNTVGKFALDGSVGTPEENELLQDDETLAYEGFGSLDDEVAGGGGDDEEGGDEAVSGSPSEPSVLNTTILALSPLGTVTTQN